MGRYVRSNRALGRAIGARTLLVDVVGEQSFELNESASLLWARLSTPAGMDDLVAVLTESVEVDPSEARDDVVALIDQLVDRGLVDQVE